jgi:ferrochelatase
MTKTAVILFNLGGPDSPEAIRPFLFNLFNDPAIIRLPNPFRYLIARMISGRREKVAQGIYAKIGGGSPILENTKKQAEALEKKLGVTCFVSMRYWHPFAEETVEAVKKFAPDQIVLLPLYPQFSTVTTASSLMSWQKTARAAGLDAAAKTICCYPEQAGFIAALAAKIRAAYGEARKFGTPRLLFSAHGLPEKTVRAGDPYPLHCRKTADALLRELNIIDLNSVLCYQSRVGPLRWIGPSTDDEIRRAGRDRAPIVIAPIAFVSEHAETLVEIDMDYRRLAALSGAPFFAYAGTVATAPAFIAGLAELVQKAIAGDETCLSGAGGRICPNGFCSCPMENRRCLTPGLKPCM